MPFRVSSVRCSVRACSDEDLFIADTGNNRIVELPFNRADHTYGEAVALGGGLSTPQALAAGPAGEIYIADTGNNRVLMLPWDSKTGAFGVAEILGTDYFTPDGIAMGLGGKLYIANFGNSTVVELKANCRATNACGTPTAVADSSGNGLVNPAGLAVSAGGSLLIAQPTSNKIVQLTWNRTTGALSSQVTLGTELNSPSGVAVDSAGNVYVADTLNSRIVKIVPQQTTGQTNSKSVLSRSRRP
jgi:sugar lactone lactonase YvrE